MVLRFLRRCGRDEAEEMKNLRACPFCPVRDTAVVVQYGVGSHTVVCARCGCVGPGHSGEKVTKAEAIRRWNTRCLRLDELPNAFRELLPSHNDSMGKPYLGGPTTEEFFNDFPPVGQ